MQMVGAFAEFERTMMRKRTSAGLARTRAERRVERQAVQEAKHDQSSRDC